MPYMISAGASFHWVTRVEAETNTLGCLKIMVIGDEVTDEQFNRSEVLLFIEDHALVKRLVAAINGAKEPA